MSIRTASPGTVAPRLASGCRVDVRRHAEDPEWDAFVEQTAGGHHAQASLWAQAKAALGWAAARVIVTQDGRILGGAQVFLVRPLPLVGTVGYVPRGPLCAAADDLSTAALVLEGLHRLSRASGVRCLVVQPPGNGDTLARRLPAWGFWPSAIGRSQPTATLRLDLAAEPETLLGGMHPQTRYNVRLGLRRGVAVRRATAADVPTFCRLLAATARRQGFAPDSEAYVTELHRRLGPRGWLELFIAEYQGEPVSAALAVCFGDTVFYKRGAWSGRHGSHRPNEAMQWHIIQWARARGYRYYDFEGIDPVVAAAVLRGEPPDLAGRTIDSFKLGFGGQAVLFPGAYGYIYNPVLRWAWQRAQPAVSKLLA
jgi:lipid II:glycine glycyltransferase (peptidoglycan interpeptide bridge formation enzyme)